jgi:Pentapeptide repeats (9 copies)
MKFWRSRFLIACAASTLTALVVGGIAFATIPNNLDGSVTACYKASAPDKGQMRIIDRQAGRACRAGESMLTWPTRIFRWRGEWNGSTAYKQNDVVSLNGSSYIALTNTTNVLPVSPGYWALMAAAGTGVGSTGPAGATGPAGPTGPSGVAQCGGYPHAGIDWSVAGSAPGTGCNLNLAVLAGQTLSGANVTNANFTQANLGNTNFTTAIVTGVDFTGANLAGANFTGAIGMGNANVTGVTWSATTCPDATLSSTNATSPESCLGHF